MTSVQRVSFDDLTVADDQSMSWKGRPFTGVAFETNDAGRVIDEANFVDGLQQGVTREWFDSGQLKSEAEYAHGSRHGLTRTWHDNGQLESEAEYKYSMKVREKTWRRDGTPSGDWSLPPDDPQQELISMMAKRFAGT